MRSDGVDDPSTYLVTFGESEAKYLVSPFTQVNRKISLFHVRAFNDIHIDYTAASYKAHNEEKESKRW